MRLRDFQTLTTFEIVELVYRKRHSILQIEINIAQNTSNNEQPYGTYKNTCHKFLKATPPLAGTVHCNDEIHWAFCHQIPLLNRYQFSDAPGDIKVTPTNLTN